MSSDTPPHHDGIPRKSMPIIGASAKNRAHFEDDWRARPLDDKPWPVVILHGTASTTGDIALLARSLRRHGWVVFAPAYGRKATRPIAESASHVSAYIDQVLSATGAHKVIIVGHSQGGVVARYYLKYFRGAAKTLHVVCLGSPNHGTSLGGLASGLIDWSVSRDLAQRACNFYFGPAGEQQLAGSVLLEELNHPDEVMPGVGYTCIATKADATIRPPSSCFLRDDGSGQVTNMWVQDSFPLYPMTHGELARHRAARSLVRRRLDEIAADYWARHGHPDSEDTASHPSGGDDR